MLLKPAANNPSGNSLLLPKASVMNSVQSYSNIVIIYYKEHQIIKFKYYDSIVVEHGLGLLPAELLSSGILGHLSFQTIGVQNK